MGVRIIGPYWLIYLFHSSTIACVPLVIPILGACVMLLVTVTCFFPSGYVFSSTVLVIVVGYVHAAKKAEIQITNSNFIFFIISASFSNVLFLTRYI